MTVIGARWPVTSGRWGKSDNVVKFTNIFENVAWETFTINTELILQLSLAKNRMGPEVATLLLVS